MGDVHKQPSKSSGGILLSSHPMKTMHSPAQGAQFDQDLNVVSMLQGQVSPYHCDEVH